MALDATGRLLIIDFDIDIYLLSINPSKYNKLDIEHVGVYTYMYIYIWLESSN